ncbi:MAG: hypothetical protein N0C84_01120 [Candidatus Thiodiazotropha taylori]|uniref:Uncharacterized protein n=1 Tax=Candidatus Thiodiazotropha taylori TaxID=2792791 RepID=A0A9E4K8N8_9GAMM|nr:hypothetical protein [Candidatus Thiodiazotropha taylori]MCW4255047.1 hypothetical protein [Candidatus Thiodiazotropha taylori]
MNNLSILNREAFRCYQTDVEMRQTGNHHIEGDCLFVVESLTFFIYDGTEYKVVTQLTSLEESAGTAVKTFQNNRVYNKGDTVFHDGIFWESLIDGNSSHPSNTENWMKTSADLDIESDEFNLRIMSAGVTSSGENRIYITAKNCPEAINDGSVIRFEDSDGPITDLTGFASSNEGLLLCDVISNDYGAEISFIVLESFVNADGLAAFSIGYDPAIVNPTKVIMIDNYGFKTSVDVEST